MGDLCLTLLGTPKVRHGDQVLLFSMRKGLAPAHRAGECPRRPAFRPKDYTELQRLISVEATSEHKESIHNLENLAAKHGLLFIWRKDENRWILEPMSEKEKAIFKAVTEEESE